MAIFPASRAQPCSRVRCEQILNRAVRLEIHLQICQNQAVNYARKMKQKVWEPVVFFDQEIQDQQNILRGKNNNMANRSACCGYPVLYV